MTNAMTKVRQQPAWIALAIVVILVLWIASGMLLADDKVNPKQVDKHHVSPLVKVSVTRLNASEVNREITLYGRTEPDRVATLRAEVKGMVEEVLVREGQFVTHGQKLFKLENTDSLNRLVSAKAMLQQRVIELDGAKSLGKQGYQSQVNLAQATANLEAAKAEVKILEFAVSKSVITAPFDGVVNEQFIEVGDLLKDGDKIATLVDLDPLVITANVTQGSVAGLQLDQVAAGRLASGEILEGKVRYISSVSDQGTNTFKVEVAVPNAGHKRVAGMSTELALPLQKTWAMRITPSVMALDELGNLGVKTVVKQRVKFIPIDIVKSDSQGVWLSGMGQQAEVIVLGHGFVRDGDEVEVAYVDENSSQDFQ
ncbi:efflux RND transporter periplasmic adaptor subunit [Paraglaciecola hydrolytica]|uniref:Efflux transporter periplasmic adaptor subunit n=1 Tax=Paraglaciecola hydrolytica TaxID=1799789 RepID=A0A148KL43_9ALTE|nr:efflux RND transporter periplasmic adaptor subunit [Paraglaciecola hydrolytica]KXI27052.1 efflux transporter periplasmic adaptor subunit [Paraglaciecola hydrolytica]